jgi:hypothetical protein
MQRAGSLIGKIKFPPAMSDPETRARAAWALAVGKKIVKYTRATLLVRGTLVVEVEDMVWQRQLATMRPLLVHNLNQALGEALVANIDFRPMPARIRPRMAQAARPQPGDALGSRDEADAIADPVMRMLYRQSQLSAQAKSVVRGAENITAQAESVVRDPEKKTAQAEFSVRDLGKRSAKR